MSVAMTDPNTQRVALVTGGGIRVGRAITLALAEADYDVVISYHSSEVATQETREAVEVRGRRCETVCADLSLPASAHLRRNWDTATLRQRAGRFREFHAFLVHDEAKDVATRSTPEAMPQALFVDGERRCLLDMERAKTDPTTTATLELYNFANDL